MVAIMKLTSARSQVGDFAAPLEKKKKKPPPDYPFLLHPRNIVSS